MKVALLRGHMKHAEHTSNFESMTVRVVAPKNDVQN